MIWILAGIPFGLGWVFGLALMKAAKYSDEHKSRDNHKYGHDRRNGRLMSRTYK
jgi:hypothetical protein